MLDEHRRRLGDILRTIHTQADTAQGINTAIEEIESVFADYAEWLDTHIAPTHRRPSFEYTTMPQGWPMTEGWTRVPECPQVCYVRGAIAVHVKDVLLYGIPIKVLSIRHRDDRPIKDWNLFLEIKNTFLGQESYAVEVYPAMSEVRDTSYTYHLMEMPIPVGFSVMQERMDG